VLSEFDRTHRDQIRGNMTMARLRPILLVEDNANDVELVLSALKRNNLANEVVIAHDGAEALDCLYGRGKFQSAPVLPCPSSCFWI
jgi:hypothetical protein